MSNTAPRPGALSLIHATAARPGSRSLKNNVAYLSPTSLFVTPSSSLLPHGDRSSHASLPLARRSTTAIMHIMDVLDPVSHLSVVGHHPCSRAVGVVEERNARGHHAMRQVAVMSTTVNGDKQRHGLRFCFKISKISHHIENDTVCNFFAHMRLQPNIEPHSNMCIALFYGSVTCSICTNVDSENKHGL